jgi:hypothetical protein
LGECYPDPASFAARTITNSGRIGSRHGEPFVREAQASCRPTLTPEAQRAVWFLGGLIRIPAGGDATGGQLAVAAPSSSGRAQKIEAAKVSKGPAKQPPTWAETAAQSAEKTAVKTTPKSNATN